MLGKTDGKRATLNIAKVSLVLFFSITTAVVSFAQTPPASAGWLGLVKPTTQAQLHAFLQAAMDGQSVMFDPVTSVTVSTTITISLPDNQGVNIYGGGYPWPRIRQLLRHHCAARQGRGLSGNGTRHLY
jgi:hypothetical protein